VSYALPGTGRVRLGVFDVTGRRVALLADEQQRIGTHRRQWDGRDEAGKPLPAGVYFVHLEHGGETSTNKIVLAR
jgi:flagellar hook assembly protein FlgD